ELGFAILGDAASHTWQRRLEELHYLEERAAVRGAACNPALAHRAREPHAARRGQPVQPRHKFHECEVTSPPGAIAPRAGLQHRRQRPRRLRPERWADPLTTSAQGGPFADA